MRIGTLFDSNVHCNFLLLCPGFVAVFSNSALQDGTKPVIPQGKTLPTSSPERRVVLTMWRGMGDPFASTSDQSIEQTGPRTRRNPQHTDTVVSKPTLNLGTRTMNGANSLGARTSAKGSGSAQALQFTPPGLKKGAILFGGGFACRGDIFLQHCQNQEATKA